MLIFSPVKSTTWFSFGLLLAALTSPIASATLFSFDGSAEPDSATFGPTFTTIRFASTSWGSDGDVLTMATAFGEGIWFGAGYAYGDNPAWNLSDNAIGNGLSLRARLSADATEWSAYLADGSRYAAFIFNNTSVQYQTDTALVTYPLDGTQFHTYDFVLKGGDVTYRVDGVRALFCVADAALDHGGVDGVVFGGLFSHEAEEDEESFDGAEHGGI